MCTDNKTSKIKQKHHREECSLDLANFALYKKEEICAKRSDSSFLTGSRNVCNWEYKTVLKSQNNNK